MQVWTVFVTGLVAGGASCSAVQGGLLAGLIARRKPPPAVVSKRQQGKRAKTRPPPPPLPWWDDAVPVGGFLAGKLVSHTILGALLGLLGSRVQLDFRTRAYLQITAGVIMLLLAANMFGVRFLRVLVPQPPARVARLIRRNARSEAMAAPALLGLATVLIPCGITLSVELLAITSGSPLTGAALLAAFVAGTTPLFAILGYAARRSATALRGQLAKVAAVAVVVAGVVSISTGVALAGGPSLTSALGRLNGGGAKSASVPFSFEPERPIVGADGVQDIRIKVGNSSYTPSRFAAKAGVPSRITLVTKGVRGCTRGFVIPSADYQKVLPETGETVIELGVSQAGTLKYTCSMGMYRGSINFT
ncbi:MAG: sulfite exporter TauE/SafE family protein [Mycobacteriales bacterium]